MVARLNERDSKRRFRHEAAMKQDATLDALAKLRDYATRIVSLQSSVAGEFQGDAFAAALDAHNKAVELKTMLDNEYRAYTRDRVAG